MTKKIYVENKPWAIIASLPFSEKDYSILPYIGQKLEPGDSIISSKPPVITYEDDGVIITPSSVSIRRNSKVLKKEFMTIKDLHYYLLRNTRFSWVVDASDTPDELLYLIISSYGIDSSKYIYDNHDDTIAHNIHIWKKYSLDAIEYYADAVNNKVVGLNAFVMRYNRFNMFVIQKENPNLFVEISNRKGKGYLHVLGKDYQAYLSFMGNMGMKPFDTNSSRGGYLHMPIDNEVEDMDIQTVKESVKEFYNKWVEVLAR